MGLLARCNPGRLSLSEFLSTEPLWHHVHTAPHRSVPYLPPPPDHLNDVVIDLKVLNRTAINEPEVEVDTKCQVHCPLAPPVALPLTTLRTLDPRRPYNLTSSCTTGVNAEMSVTLSAVRNLKVLNMCSTHCHLPLLIQEQSITCGT
jgi:hypothetical protein